jgi:hypothetical protein
MSYYFQAVIITLRQWKTKVTLDSYYREAEDVSVEDSGSDTTMSKARITDSTSSVNIQAREFVEVNISGLPYSTKHFSTAQITWDNNEVVYMQKVFLCYSVLKEITHLHYFICNQRS